MRIKVIEGIGCTTVVADEDILYGTATHPKVEGQWYEYPDKKTIFTKRKHLKLFRKSSH